MALLAGDVDVGQEVHLDLDLAVAVADLAAAALDVEAEAARLVAARPRLLGLGEELADVVEDAGVGGRVGARRAADRRLVDVDDLVDLARGRRSPSWAPGRSLRPVQAVGDRAVEDLVDEGRLARAGDAGDAAEDAERDRDVDVLEVVLARAADDAARRAARAARSGTAICRLPERYWPVSEAGVRGDLVPACPRRHVAAVLAGAGAEVDDVVGGAHRPLVVLDDDHRVAEVAEPVERVDQLLVVALVEADRGLVEDVQDADQAASRSGSRAGSAAPRRRRACAPSASSER